MLSKHRLLPMLGPNHNFRGRRIKANTHRRKSVEAVNFSPLTASNDHRVQDQMPDLTAE